MYTAMMACADGTRNRTGKIRPKITQNTIRMTLKIAENGWLTCPATPELLFDTDIDRKYDRILASIGIDPAHLPFVGRNLLGAAEDVPVLRPYGDWLDRAHLLITPDATSFCTSASYSAADANEPASPDVGQRDQISERLLA